MRVPNNKHCFTAAGLLLLLAAVFVLGLTDDIFRSKSRARAARSVRLDDHDHDHALEASALGFEQAGPSLSDLPLDVPAAIHGSVPPTYSEIVIVSEPDAGSPAVLPSVFGRAPPRLVA